METSTIVYLTAAIVIVAFCIGFIRGACYMKNQINKLN